MNEHLEKIEKIETEITKAVNIKAVAVSSLSFTTDKFLRSEIRAQIGGLSNQIAEAQAEIERIETAHFAEIARARRAAKYPPIAEVKQSTIRFADGLSSPPRPRITGQAGIEKIYALGQSLKAQSPAGNYQEARS